MTRRGDKGTKNAEWQHLSHIKLGSVRYEIDAGERDGQISAVWGVHNVVRTSGFSS